MSAEQIATISEVDPTVAEREYVEQLRHADQLIDELVNERDQLVAENVQLKKALGVASLNGHRQVRGQGRLI